MAKSIPGWKSLLPLLLFVGLVTAADPARLEKTFDTTPNPRITLNNLSGQVTIKGWNRAQVHAVCTTSSPRVEIDTEPLPSTGRAEKVHFDTHLLDPLLTGKDQSADYSIEVPAGSDLAVTNRQGSVEISNLQGEASVECVGGTISVKDVAGHLALRSVGGDIEVVRPAGRVEASSITGDLHFISPSSSQVHGITTSGKILYEGDLVARGEYKFSTYSGDIDVACPASASFELNAKSVRHKVQGDLSVTPKRHSASSLGNSLTGLRNAGKASLELKSFSGAIRIRPQPQ